MATKMKEVDAVIVGLGWTGGILSLPIRFGLALHRRCRQPPLKARYCEYRSQ